MGRSELPRGLGVEVSVVEIQALGQGLQGKGCRAAIFSRFRHSDQNWERFADKRNS